MPDSVVVYEGVPVARAVPPLADAYQSMVAPLDAAAVMVTLPPPHLDVPVADVTVGIAAIVSICRELTASIYNLLVVPTQGSPNVALLAVSVKLLLPSAAACTTDTEVEEWQVLVVKAPQLPLGVP